MISDTNQIKVLSLFSGTKSISKECILRNWEVISVDIEKKFNPSILTDIMTWDYTIYEPGHFDIITASPVCLWWSILRRSNIGRFGITSDTLRADIDTYGKPMVNKVFEIIDYFKPKYWWIENPQTGLMKTYITDKPYYDVDYCRYGFEYRKRTRFWTNITNFEPIPLCKQDCESIVTITRASGKISKLHKKHYNSKARQNIKESKHQGTNKYERYRIPPKLINDLLDGCI